MLQGRIKKFKVPVDNNIDNFIKDINIRKNEYIYACDLVDDDNINLRSENVISLFDYLNESYSNVLLLLCQEGFDSILNYMKVCNNLSDIENEKIFGCLTILIEKGVDIFKNYYKCLEKCHKKDEFYNDSEKMEIIINENNK
ncbi:hypothetical protein PFFVO_04643 [Plasmodium falciparum Vietnam Oak-Knoll (FVO)]|uniref:Uncharacterized protein n=1 Tax=Plasmodium falciparum Vietnam Oak-Knoll (FVO) TaxID=1036723 RepID=A0A024V0L8_PLAFA|nr:hypothetical protein PFFVO_04643 [Plasmodium falciparum Vietnam Oak-Knoll (FVO)]